jgi:hypothetical protein
VKSILAICCLTLLLEACSPPEKGPVSGLAENAATLKACVDDRHHCIGGFMKSSGRSGLIVRIMNCGNNCSPYEIDWGTIEIRMAMKDPWLPSSVEWVVLPTYQNWGRRAEEYERQFVNN